MANIHLYNFWSETSWRLYNSSDNTVISGGAFGDYNPEPVPAITINGASSTVFGIVDSQNDNSDG